MIVPALDVFPISWERETGVINEEQFKEQSHGVLSEEAAAVGVRTLGSGLRMGCRTRQGEVEMEQGLEDRHDFTWQKEHQRAKDRWEKPPRPPPAPYP